MKKRTFWILVEKIVHSTLHSLYVLCGKDLNEKTYIACMQFIKFGMVGVSNTLISYCIYLGGLILFREFKLFSMTDYLMAQIVAFIVSVSWSFYWNNKLVFVLNNGEKRNFWRALLKTYVSYSFTGLFLNSILLFIWVQVLHISEFIAPIINLFVTVPLNFVMNKLWAFKSD